MSRYLGPRIKIIRRLGLLPGLTKKILQFKPNLSSKLVTKKQVSQYRVRLEEKQKLRFHYGLTERQLLRYVRIARKTKGSTGHVLLQLLEMRLDNTVFRLGMTLTIPAARQLVNHGHILVNNQVVDIPSYCCKLKDIVAIRNRMTSRDLIDQNLNNFQQPKIPNHLTFTATNRTAFVNKLVDRASIGVQINELLVVEYYSRQA